MTKILSIVVTYYPSKKLLEDNINAFIDFVDKVLIWENTPKEERDHYRFIFREKVEYCGDGINSISRALNYAWKYAKMNKFDYLLTMDQDSVWNNVEVFLNKTIFNVDAPFGIYGPCINEEIHQELFSQTELITSGMLSPISIIDKIGGYNEFFRIDGIDTWLCYKAKELDIGTYRVSGCVLNQHYGNLHKERIGRIYVFHTLDYPPIRLYEIFKSYVLILRRFHTSKRLKKQFFYELLVKHTIKVLLIENKKYAKIKAILSGIMDGLFYKNLKML